MTTFEPWQAGGPEPVMVAELPSPWGPPWRKAWRLHFYGLEYLMRERAEEAEAAKECRDALESATAWLILFDEWDPMDDGPCEEES